MIQKITTVFAIFALTIVIIAIFYTRSLANQELRLNAIPFLAIIERDLNNAGSPLNINLKIALGEWPFAFVIYDQRLKEYIVIKSKNSVWNDITDSQILEKLESTTLVLENSRASIHMLNYYGVPFYITFFGTWIVLLLFAILLPYFFVLLIAKKEFWKESIKRKREILQNEEEKQKTLHKEISELQETLAEKENYIINFIKNNNHLGQRIEKTQMFLSNAAFEIKTPLKAIISLIHSFHTFSLTPLQNKYLEVIEQSTIILTQVMNGLISTSSQIQDFDEGKNGDVDCSEIFEIDSLMNTIVGLFAPLLHMKKIELHYEITANVPRLINGPRGHIMQMIINLMDFCYEYSIEGKDLQMQIKSHQENGLKGIELTIQSHLFYGKELSIENLEKDLYLVYKYSRRHNYFFNIIEKNKIKQIRLFISFRPLPLEDTDWFTFLAKRKKITEKKILYIDDQVNSVHLIKSYLEYFKITYDFFEDPWSAEKTLVQRYDDFLVVIINTDFHKGASHDFIKMLKLNARLNHITFWPVIDMDELDHIKDLKDIGIKHFLTRPICRDNFFYYLAQEYYESSVLHLSSQKMKKVLLIDDAMEECKIISLYLKTGPIELKLAHGAQSAHGMILSENYDLIICAMDVPEYDFMDEVLHQKVIEIRTDSNVSVFSNTNLIKLIEKQNSFIVRPIEKNKFLYILRKRLFHHAKLLS